jgi:hypothetical protein
MWGAQRPVTPWPKQKDHPHASSLNPYVQTLAHEVPMQLKPFLLDAWLDQYEHGIEFNLAASTGPTWTVNEILDLATSWYTVTPPATTACAKPSPKCRVSRSTPSRS